MTFKVNGKIELCALSIFPNYACWKGMKNLTYIRQIKFIREEKINIVTSLND